MFMTSRESAIALFPSPHNQAHTSRPCQPIWAIPGEVIPRFKLRSSEFRCAEHSSTLKNTKTRRISVFCRVFCRFLGSKKDRNYIVDQYMVLVWLRSQY